MHNHLLPFHLQQGDVRHPPPPPHTRQRAKGAQLTALHVTRQRPWLENPLPALQALC